MYIYILCVCVYNAKVVRRRQPYTTMTMCNKLTQRCIFRISKRNATFTLSLCWFLQLFLLLCWRTLSAS